MITRNIFKSIKSFFMNSITINGKTTSVSGRNISIINGKVTVDGIVISEGLIGDVHVKFEGDLANLNATSVEVNGNVTGKVDCTSLIVTGDIHGNVDSTSVKANNIHGDVDAVSVKYKK